MMVRAGEPERLAPRILYRARGMEFGAGYRMIPKKPALGLDPRVGTGFRKRSCSNKRLGRDDDSKKSHRALASETCPDRLRRQGATIGRDAITGWRKSMPANSVPSSNQERGAGPPHNVWRWASRNAHFFGSRSGST